MRTLEDAWKWYLSVKNGMNHLGRLSKHWQGFPVESQDAWVVRIGRDNELGALEAVQMEEMAASALKELDDLAVLVLFSVFEASVRDFVEAEVRPEAQSLRHPALIQAGKEVMQTNSEGSFFRVLEPFKSAEQNDLIEQVNQIRRYRNWVAHGKRNDMKPGASVQPRQAYERLSDFLSVIRGPSPVPLASAPE